MSDIFIDFECLAPPRGQRGAAASRPLLLGVLWPDGTVKQFIVDEELNDAARADRKHCVVSSLRGAVEQVLSKAIEGNHRIVSWSTFDYQIILAHAGLDEGRRACLEVHYVNALHDARRWSHIWRLPPARDGERDNNAINRYMAATRYNLPPHLLDVQPARLLRHVRAQIRTNGRYRGTTPETKRDWHLVLEYNRHDLLGLRHVHERVASDLRLVDWYKESLVTVETGRRPIRWTEGAGAPAGLVGLLNARSALRYAVFAWEPESGLYRDAWLDNLAVGLAAEGVAAAPAMVVLHRQSAQAVPALLAFNLTQREGRRFAREHGLRMFLRGHRDGRMMVTVASPGSPDGAQRMRTKR